MATSSTEDDFHLRFRKKFKAPFREAIIPSHILPYLQVLTTVEEVCLFELFELFTVVLGATSACFHVILSFFLILTDLKRKRN